MMKVQENRDLEIMYKSHSLIYFKYLYGKVENRNSLVRCFCVTETKKLL